MEKNLNRQMLNWMRHWYLAARDSYAMLSCDEKKREKKVYQEIRRLIDQQISKTASPLE